MGKAGRGGTELAVLDMVGGITGALPSTSWRALAKQGHTHRQPDTTPLASLRSQCAVHLPVRSSVGTDARPGAQRPLPSAPSNPARGLGSQQGDSEPRGDTVSSSETGYSIRVTPTCKTDNCIDKTAPSGQFHTSGPCLGRQGHRAGRTGPPSLSKAA